MAAITQGKDFNYFKKVTVINAEFDSENPEVVFNFRNQVAFSIINEGDTIVEYSFNSSTLHGDMTPGTPSSAIVFDNRRVSKIWFRNPSGGSNIVRVEAWAAI